METKKSYLEYFISLVQTDCIDSRGMCEKLIVSKTSQIYVPIRAEKSSERTTKFSDSEINCKDQDVQAAYLFSHHNGKD